MPKRPDLPVYFTKLELENIRSFSERQELKLLNDDDLPARWTLIVGDNGVGKTTLLQCLARMSPVFNDPSDNENEQWSKPVEPDWAGEDDNEVLSALARYGNAKPARLRAYLSVGVTLDARKKSRQGIISTSLEFIRTKDGIKNFDPGGESSRDVKEPLVLGYGAGRHPRDTNVDKVTPTGPIESLFKVSAELHDAEELLCRLDYSSLKDRPDAKKLLNSLKKMLSEILPEIERPENIKILGPPTPGCPSNQTGVQVKTHSGYVPLSQLSLGYQTVSAWTVDIARRLFERYPKSSNPLHGPAIVVVDEIDLHLHPLWQRKIRGHLIKHFPNVQFIATAHSPLMVQSSLNENLAVVRWQDDHMVIDNDPIAIRDWRLDQVLTSDLFGFESARPPEVAKLQKRRRELVQKQRPSDAERRELDKLDRMILDLPTAETPEDQKAMEIIRRAAERLESGNESL